MPTNHIDQWLHNRQFLSTIDPDYPDWAVTVTFYTALHAVDALLQSDQVEGIVSHAARNQTLNHTNRYRRVWRAYQPLYDLSRTVRYMANPRAWVPWNCIQSEVFRRYLYPLEDSVQKLMQESLRLGPVLLRSPDPEQQ
jgi:hypothetical protein